MLQKALIVAVCLAVIGASVYFILPREHRTPAEKLRQPYACEACGHRFLGPPEPQVLPCPSCGKPAGVQVCEFECGGCAARFEAFRMRLRDGRMEYRRPDGAWIPAEQFGPIVCPECRSAQVHRAKPLLPPEP